MLYESDSPERDWQREQRAQERFLRETYCDRQAELDQAETGCTPEEIRYIPPMQASLFPDEMPDRLQPVLVSRPKEARRG